MARFLEDHTRVYLDLGTRRLQNHDVLHCLLGYGVDLPGEQRGQAFLLGYGVDLPGEQRGQAFLLGSRRVFWLNYLSIEYLTLRCSLQLRGVLTAFQRGRMVGLDPDRLLFVHTARGRFVLDRSMEELEQRLASRFFRCHRSAMIALERVIELSREAGGTAEVVLSDGAQVPASREGLAALKRAIET
mgnify:CR=1 FL=1